MKLKETSTEPGLEVIASEGNGLVMIVWTCDFELCRCVHSSCTSIRERPNRISCATQTAIGREEFGQDPLERPANLE